MIELIHGDCLEEMKKLEADSVDLILTDPPYGLEFMGKDWDKGVPGVHFWVEMLRVLKPGGYLLSFSGTRTYHRMGTAIEDAGFEIRDMIEWVYGSGFPKSLNIGKVVHKFLKTGNASWNGTGDSSNGALGYSKLQHQQGYRPDDYSNKHQNKEGYSEIECQNCNGSGELNIGANVCWKCNGSGKIRNEWEGWGTALKPAHEPICMARKPLAEKTVAENVLKYGTGGINIDESRIISYTTAYNDGDNNDCTFQEHTMLEIRHKICSQPPFSLSGSLELSRLSNDDEYGQKWYKQRDYSDDCSSCLRLYDALLPLFLNGGQVSVQQLHDVLSDIDHLRTEQKHNLSIQDSDHPSSLDDFYQILLSYLNDTTLILNKQEKITLNLNKKGEQLFNEGDVKKAKWSGNSEERIGRFPANLIHDGSDEVKECFPNESERFFKSIIYQAKASKSERNKGCEELEETYKKRIWAQSELSKTDFGCQENKHPTTNNHPTVKPVALMEYLAKMCSTEGAVVLDPFMGSGTTGVACKNLNRNFIGIELDETYYKIAQKRIHDSNN